MICQRSCRQLRAEIDSRSKTRNRSPKTRYSLTHKSDRWQEVTCEVPDTCDICSQVLHCTVLKKILPAFCYGTNTPQGISLTALGKATFAWTVRLLCPPLCVHEQSRGQARNLWRGKKAEQGSPCLFKFCTRCRKSLLTSPLPMWNVRSFGQDLGIRQPLPAPGRVCQMNDWHKQEPQGSCLKPLQKINSFQGFLGLPETSYGTRVTYWYFVRV